MPARAGRLRRQRPQALRSGGTTREFSFDERVQPGEGRAVANAPASLRKINVGWCAGEHRQIPSRWTGRQGRTCAWRVYFSDRRLAIAAAVSATGASWRRMASASRSAQCREDHLTAQGSPWKSREPACNKGQHGRCECSGLIDLSGEHCGAPTSRRLGSQLNPRACSSCPMRSGVGTIEPLLPQTRSIFSLLSSLLICNAHGLRPINSTGPVDRSGELPQVNVGV